MGGLCQRQPAARWPGDGGHRAHIGRRGRASGGIVTRRILKVVVAVLFLLGGKASGQTTSSGPAVPPAQTVTNPWSFTASTYTYLVPESQNYVNPNFTADRGWF